jgi:hypothetical protein
MHENLRSRAVRAWVLAAAIAAIGLVASVAAAQSPPRGRPGRMPRRAAECPSQQPASGSPCARAAVCGYGSASSREGSHADICSCQPDPGAETAVWVCRPGPAAVH